MSDSILPPNATRAELACERAIAATRPDLTPVAALMNPDTCPKHLLPWLAWALSVDFWDAGWSEAVKRASIRESVGIHRVKGTLRSVQRALTAAGYPGANVVERSGHELHNATHSYDGSIIHSSPDHWAEYRVYLTHPITIEQAAQVRAILRLVAPARCRLKGLFFPQALNSYNSRITYDGAFTHGVA